MQTETPQVSRLRAPVFSASLGVGVLVVRALSSGPAYYQDAPRHLKAIANHTYVIQPPGYWLFTRLGGLFPNPDHGLLLMNWCFSALGCVAFYLCARLLVRSTLAEWGALLYATIFFAWFSGNIQTTYASQLLFAPLTFYCMLRSLEDKRTVWLLAVSASFALGAGFRPSDGVFLVPLLIVFALKLPRQQQLMLAILSAVFCLCWFIPNQVALHRFQSKTAGGQLTMVAEGAIVFGRINTYTIANAFRFFLPLTLALGPTVLFLLRARNAVVPLLWAWVLPGTVFYLLVFISDPLYIDCLLGGIILLCLLGMEASRNRRLTVAALICSIAINVGFYVGFRPLPLRSNAYALVDRDLGNFSLYAIKHQYWIKRLHLAQNAQ